MAGLLTFWSVLMLFHPLIMAALCLVIAALLAAGFWWAWRRLE